MFFITFGQFIFYFISKFDGPFLKPSQNLDFKQTVQRIDALKHH